MWKWGIGGVGCWVEDGVGMRRSGDGVSGWEGG